MENRFIEYYKTALKIKYRTLNLTKFVSNVDVMRNYKKYLLTVYSILGL